MRIQMNTLMAGPDGVLEAGQVYEVDDKQATALIKGGYAVAIKGRAVETAAQINSGEEQPVERDDTETTDKNKRSSKRTTNNRRSKKSSKS